jgi:hypothetical protein
MQAVGCLAFTAAPLAPESKQWLVSQLRYSETDSLAVVDMCESYATAHTKHRLHYDQTTICMNVPPLVGALLLLLLLSAWPLSSPIAYACQQ